MSPKARARADSSATSTPSSSTAALSLPLAASKSSDTASIRSHKSLNHTRSWYGSLSRKSAASTQLARESITGDTFKPLPTADFSRFDTSTKKNGDVMSLDGVPESSASSSRTLKHETSRPGEVGVLKGQDVSSNNSRQVEAQGAVPKPTSAEMHHETEEPGNGAIQPPETPDKTEHIDLPGSSPGWLNWFAGRQAEQLRPTVPPSTADAGVKEGDPDEQQPPPTPVAIEPSTEPASHEQPSTPPARTSWFGFWSSSAPTTEPPTTGATGEGHPTKEPEDVVMDDAPPAQASEEPDIKSPPRVGSTWAFWSRDNGSKANEQTPSKANGQLAVIGESSESQPENRTSMEMSDNPPQKEPPLKSIRKDETGKQSTASKELSSKKSKRLRPKSMDPDEPTTPDRPDTPMSATSGKSETTTKAGSSKSPAASKSQPQNILLPSFKGTYRMKDNPSILRQIAQLLLRTQSPQANHVFLSREMPKVKRAIAIGVHGLFPANYLRPMIGQPTGTSIKFANHCAEGIRRWADSHGHEDCEIEKVALEGEGKIGERVENLWKLLLNWIDQLRKADLIMVACHSQGVPVGIMLLAKLIELGIITGAKIGVCAMAGVSLGPFSEYRSGMGMLMGAANELWEFANPESDNSQKLEASVKAVLAYGARITYIGSIDDQLVPLESAIYSPAHHPYIYRAVFIDGRLHAPDFIAHLVGFALKLRNLGISDHGLIRELSIPLAGSLYGGEGHSRLYDDAEVYDLAISHTLETSDFGHVPCTIHKFEALTNPNPYHLPWIMRGLLEEDFVKTELYSESEELLRQFDDWKPTTKALKDVKYRLEAVRSKL